MSMRPHLKLTNDNYMPKNPNLKDSNSHPISFFFSPTFWRVALNVRDAMKTETYAITCEWSLLTVDIYIFCCYDDDMHETCPSAQVIRTRKSPNFTNLILFL